MRDDKQLDLIVSMMNELKNDTKALRDSSQDIRDNLFQVTSQFELLRLDTQNEKAKNEKEVQVLNEKLKEGQKSIEKLDKKITDDLAVLKKLEPKVERLFTTYIWVARAFVLAVATAVIGLIIKIK